MNVGPKLGFGEGPDGSDKGVGGIPVEEDRGWEEPGDDGGLVWVEEGPGVGTDEVWKVNQGTEDSQGFPVEGSLWEGLGPI